MCAFFTGYGNITSENTRTLVYNLSNQLIQVLDGGIQTAAYTYNGAGQRIKKVTQTETRIFHYDLKGHLIAETSQTGQMLAEYVYLGDQLLSMIKPGESVYYFHKDHLGTPQVLTDDSGTVSWKATYTPFGQAQVVIETVTNPFRLPGQYYDQETGFHYNYFRYYNPQTGRYITPDPIGLEGGINLFSYVQNNPINWIDPIGLFQLCFQNRWGYMTTITCGNDVYYLTEPAPVDPKAPYEQDQQLAPGLYYLLPRETSGSLFKRGDPVYTTPGQEAGIVITPSGKIRGGDEYGPAGPHIAGIYKQSKGCPLFERTTEGERQKEKFYRNFRKNIKTGGTWIIIFDRNQSSESSRWSIRFK